MKMKWILASTAAWLAVVGYSGQLLAASHESAGGLTCADVEFKSMITDALPNANDACLSVVEIDGRPFAEFKAEIVRNRGATTRARFQRADGSWTDVYEFTPDKSRTIRIGGRSYRLRDMQRGQQLNIYLPPDRFEVAVADDDDLATVPLTLVTVTAVRMPAAAELPTTAGLVPLIGMLGGLSVALGGSLAAIRRIRS